jgi:4-amino-4-deoxy-L-arabinose transferase-like glycosyltransferase
MAKINRRPGSDDDRPAADGGPARRLVRVRPEHLGLAGVLLLSCLLELRRLSQNGFANDYYSAAVKSMLRSFHNFFFVSFDPGGLISVDKPPLGLWLEAVSAKIFGFAPLPLLLPEAICAVLAVALVYFVVAPRLGALAGLASALALAVFPSFVAVGRDNTLDSLLILLMLVGCAVAVRAFESGRTRTLLLSALVIGLAFNTKSLAALLCVPGIGLGYLVAGPGSSRRRAGQLALAGIVLAVVSISWSLAVDLTPASQRPYVGSSSDNSEFGLEFGYNGLGRVGGQTGGPGTSVVAANATDVPVIQPPPPAATRTKSETPAKTSSPAKAKHSATAVAKPTGRVRRVTPIPFGGPRSPLRIFGTGLGDQGGWTVPLAVIGMIAMAFVALRGRALRDRRSGVLYVLGGWFLVELLALDFSNGIVHPYYVSALGPGLAAMVGGGAAAIAGLVRSEDKRSSGIGVALAALAAITTAAIEVKLIDREGYPEHWRLPLAVLCLAAVAAIVLWRRRASWTVAALVLVLLVAPALYSHTVWDAPVDGTFPTAGPYNVAGFGGIDLQPGSVRLNRALARYLTTHDATKRFAVLSQASDVSSPLILIGLHAAALGGYNTTDPAVSADGLARLVAENEARYVVLGGPYYYRGGNAAETAARLACPLIPQVSWDPAQASSRTFFLVDCRGRAAALRNPVAAAGAYLSGHPQRMRPFAPRLYKDRTGVPTTVIASLTIYAKGDVTITSGPTLTGGGTPTTGGAGPPQTVTTAASGLASFHLPAYWYFKVTGPATVGAVTQR